jgi:hypothetical protein
MSAGVVLDWSVGDGAVRLPALVRLLAGRRGLS